MDFQTWWDKQIDILEEQGWSSSMMNKFYDIARIAWDAGRQDFMNRLMKDAKGC